MVKHWTPEIIPHNTGAQYPAEMVQPNDATEDEDRYVLASEFHKLEAMLKQLLAGPLSSPSDYCLPQVRQAVADLLAGSTPAKEVK
jgi:hypothetical protein